LQFTTTQGKPFPVGGHGTLLAGDTVGYSGWYTPTVNLCGPFNDTVVAYGTDTAPVAKTVYATNSATCTVCRTAAITVINQCPQTNGTPGSVITFSGEVCNNGDAPLANISVFTDQVMSNGTNLVASYPLLTNHECRSFIISYIFRHMSARS